jgi:glycosyltransferase involved in cell wall biosynthesis
MRVGIYLGDFSPDVGGGFTFQDDVFRAFAQLAVQSPHQFVVMGTADGLQRYIQTVSTLGTMQVAHIAITSGEKRIEALKVYSPLLRKILPAGPIARAAKKHGLDCLWYVGGGAYEAIDVPYIATVWDLQHRMTPWFPEMSADGTWDARELTYRRFLQRASYVVTGTEAGRSELSLCYEIAAGRIRLLPHPTPSFAVQDPARPETGIGKRLGLPEGYLLYPAQFWPHKNHVNLLHALRILRDEHGLSLPLVLAGSEKGNVRYVKQVADDLKLSQLVFFTGFVTQAELVDLYCGASMLVYASLCGPENLPPLEAFALGCPVAAAEVPGVREQLKSAAIFFDPIDPEDIADKIQTLHLGVDLKSDLRIRGYSRAQAWTSLDFAKGILNLIDEFSVYRRCWPCGGEN